jgi:outer membrane receptor protein involved in Fe transport
MSKNAGIGAAVSRLSLCLALATGAAGAASAQDAAPAPDRSGSTIDEIIVTAQKREQSLSDVGISVSVLGNETLQNLGIEDSIAIVNFVPNVENTSIYGPGTNTNFSVRGVAQNDSNDGTEAPIATYVDDVYLVTTGAGAFPLHDLERVEVLRGPQGTLFGRNSTGGLIHYISAKPVDAFEGRLSGSYGSYDERSVSGMINVPIAPGTAAVRIAGLYKNNDGWLNNRSGTQPDGGQVESASIRASLLLTPTDTITNVFRISYDHAEGYTSGIWRDAIGQDPVTGDQFVLPAGSLDAVGQGPVLGEADNGQLRKLLGAKSVLAVNKLDWEVGNVTVTSVTAYNDYRRNTVEDCDGTQVAICATHYNNPSHQFSQELRAFIDAGSSRFTVGAYYLNQLSKQNVIAPLFQFVGPGSVALKATVNQRSKGYAIFANGEFDLSDQFTLIAGIRGSRDLKSIQQVNGIYLPTNPATPFAGYEDNAELPVGAAVGENIFTDATAGGLNRLKKNLWSAKVELDYKPSDDTLIYASFSRGVKAPGFNNGLVSVGLPFASYRYRDETLLAYEVGLKTTFWDRRASFNAAAFYYDYSDYHTLAFVGVGSFITNSDAKLYGIEADFTVKPAEGLTIQVNGGLLKSKLYDVPNAGLVVADREMPIAPSWTISGLIRYELPVFGGGHKLGLQVDGRARDAFYNDPANNSASVVPSYGVVNASIDLAEVDDKYRIALSVKNIFDKQYETSIFLLNGVAGYRYGFYAPPRWVSADVSFRF